MTTTTIVIVIAAPLVAMIAAWIAYRLASAKGAARSEALQARLQEYEKSLTERNGIIERQEKRVAELTAETQIKGAAVSRLEATLLSERRSSEEKLTLLEQARQSLGEHFSALATEIFDTRTKQYSEQSRAALAQFLQPFREQIGMFQQEVRTRNEAAIREHSSLKTQLEQLAKQNRLLGEEATNLTNALKGESQTRGAWGELTLKRALEMSGLQEGHEYQMQQTLRSEEGKAQRPDCIINLPEGRTVIIDSKVSLNAYTDLAEAKAEERERCLRRHLDSLRRHLKSLEKSQYQQLPGIDTLDFVFMFIPIEGALLTALQYDNSIFEEAFRKRIVLVSPSTLLAVLRTIEHLWRVERQNRSVKEIATEAGKMYDQFARFVDDLESVGTHLRRSNESWEGAMKRLSTGRGNLLGRAEKVRKLGAPIKKALPPGLVEESTEQD